MEADMETAGAAATAALAAKVIDGAKSQGHGRAHAHGPCANCGAELVGRFCHACGQSAHLHHSLLHLAEEVLHGVLHFDAKGLRTLPLLIGKPGALTRRYIDGQRTRHVSPLALFLFMMFFMFFAFSFSAGTNVVSDIPDKERAQLAKEADKLLKGATIDIEVGEESAAKAEAVPAPAASAGKPSSARVAIAQAMKNPELALYKLKNTAYKFSFMLIPISLPFLWLMFVWRRGITMYDHAVFSLYSLSFMALFFSSLALLALTPLPLPYLTLILCVPPLHMFFQLRGTYALSIGSALWRTIALLFVAGTVFLLFLAFIAVMSAR